MPGQVDNLTELKDVFEFPAGQPRRVWVYLPPAYYESKRHYPVVYMHDGQNLFQNGEEEGPQWAVGRALNRLAEQGKQVPVVVAIAHGGDNRLNELGPWPNPKFGKAQGNRYARFLVEKIKSHIDKHYRTLSEASDTTIMGSSMGGLMSHYIIHAYPHIFGKAAMLSPSFWVSEQAYTFAKGNPLPHTHKMYFATGAKEGQKMISSLLNMVHLYDVLRHPLSHMHVALIEGASHNETFWQEQFVPALTYLEVIADEAE